MTSRTRELPASLAGLGVTALALCCGLPAVIAAGVAAWLVVGVLGAVLVSVAVVALIWRHERVGIDRRPSDGDE